MHPTAEVDQHKQPMHSQLLHLSALAANVGAQQMYFITLNYNNKILEDNHKGSFKYYVITGGGGGGLPKYDN